MFATQAPSNNPRLRFIPFKYSHQPHPVLHQKITSVPSENQPVPENTPARRYHQRKRRRIMKMLGTCRSPLSLRIGRCIDIHDDMVISLGEKENTHSISPDSNEEM